MPLELYIFEDRYKLMINRCLENRAPFGVVLIRRGKAEYGPLAHPYSVGCTAHITQVHPLGQGRMNIVAIGLERFRIHSTQNDKPYLVGQVDNFPLQDTALPSVEASANRLERLVRHYLEMLDRANQLRFRSQQLPKDPVALAYLASVLLHLPPIQQKVLLGWLMVSASPIEQRSFRPQNFITQQQALLECSTAEELLNMLHRIYQREVALLDIILKAQFKTDTQDPFSAN